MDDTNPFTFNQEQSDKLKASQVYKQYNQWLKSNGVLIDSSLVYPALFGDRKKGVVGVAANKPIPSNYAIIAVPYDLIITVQKVKDEKDLFKIITQNPTIFQINQEAAFSILVLYVCRELIKEKKSFYAPYFAIANEISLVNWTHWDMLAVQNVEVTRLMKGQAEQIQENFMAFLSIFRRYPQVFPESMSNLQYKQIFEKAYNFICTRAFGWSLPSISLIPMADSLNHNNDYVTHMLIDTKLELQSHNMYRVKNKKYNLTLLAQAYPQVPKSQPPRRKKHRVDAFVQKHKQILDGASKKDPQAHILLNQYKAGVRNFRQLHFYEQSCQQDNDTDEQTVQSYQFQLEQYRFYQKYETKGINEKNMAKQLEKYWKIFLAPIFNEQQSDEDLQKQKTNAKQPQQIQKMKQKYANQSKQSQGSSLVDSSSSSDSDDQQFKWMAQNPDTHNHKTTYFLMATRGSIKKNQQIFNFYGRRSNRFLLIGYNFVLQDNKYDSFAFRINIDNWKAANKPFATKLPVSKTINRAGKLTTYFSRQIRVKSQHICLELVNHCRALLIGWGEAKTDMETKKVTITIPFSIQFQKKVLQLAAEFLKTMQKQFMTSIEEDQQLIDKAQKYETIAAIHLRLNYKKILQSQLELISQCQNYLKLWKNGKLNVSNEAQMRKIGKVKQYLGSLQRGKL